jgi:hypothetical protein
MEYSVKKKARLSGVIRYSVLLLGFMFSVTLAAQTAIFDGSTLSIPYLAEVTSQGYSEELFTVLTS